MNLLEVDFDKLRAILGTDLETGLSLEQVFNNEEEFGENIIFRSKKNLFDVFKHIFSDIMIIIVLLIGMISLFKSGFNIYVLSSVLSVFLIMCFAVVAFIFRKKAEKLTARFLRDKYKALRSGRITTVDRTKIVPGDIIILEKGDILPCDGIVLNQSQLKVIQVKEDGKAHVLKKVTLNDSNEITGIPYSDCLLYAGSAVISGNCRLFVCNTGSDILNKSNPSISRQVTSMPQIYEIAFNLKKQISLIWILMCFLLFTWGIYFGNSIFDMFAFSCILVVSAFPDAIEYLSDISLSFATIKLFNLGIVMRNAGAIDKLCNVDSVFVHSGECFYYAQTSPGYFVLGSNMFKFSESPRLARELLESLILTENNLDSKRKGINNEIDIENRAINAAAVKAGIQKKNVEAKNMYISRYDFDKNFGYSCSVVMNDNGYRVIAKGNPSFIIPLCSSQYYPDGNVDINDFSIKNIHSSYRSLAGVCEKIYAVAVKDVIYPSSTGDQRALCKDMTFLGMFGLYTPISAECASEIRNCGKAGINTYIMTNDFPETVNYLAKTVSVISENDYQYGLNASKFRKMHKGVFIADIDKYKAFCEFSPEEKQEVISFHKNEGKITCSLTSGIYDSLSQIESDISFSVPSSSNSVRLNSDFIIRKKKFSLIPETINWSRTFYKNIVHIMQYIVTLQFAMYLTVFIGIATDSKLVFNSLQTVILGILMCVPFALNIAFKSSGKEFESNVKNFDKTVSSTGNLIPVPAIFGIIVSLISSISYQVSLHLTDSSHFASKSAFLTLSFAMYFLSLSMKNESSFFKNLKSINLSDAISFGLLILFNAIFTFSPISRYAVSDFADIPSTHPFARYLIAFVLSLIPFSVKEISKIFSSQKPEKSMKGENHASN